MAVPPAAGPGGPPAVQPRPGTEHAAAPGHAGLGLRGRLAAVPGEARYVAVLAVLAAAAAVVLRHTVFPVLSVNNDEGIYLLHARTLAEGRLFPRAPHPAQSYVPWLGVVVDDHYVLKYTPFVPAIFALALVVCGSVDPALAVVVGAAVVVTYHLGVELSGSRRVAALSATLLALSPLVLVQSAMVLSYLPVLVLLQGCVLGVLRGRRRGRARPVVVAGLALGVAGAVRPYDVVLLLAPLAVWLVVTSPGRRWWLLRWLACGLAAPLAITLLTNLAATGNALRLPFALLEPDDRLGFGRRKLYPEDGWHHFGLGDGLRSVGDHVWLLGGWACGGVVLAVAAIIAALRRRLNGAAAMLGLGGLLFLLGYIGFWGTWNAAELWGGIRYVGPFYLVPVLIPLVHLGGWGCVSGGAALLAWRRRVGLGVLGSVVAAVVALTSVVLTGAVRDNLALTGNDKDLSAMLSRLPGRPLVFVAANPKYLGHPTPVAANGPDLDGRVLFAVARGVDDLTVLADHPGRPAYLLRLAQAYDRLPGSPSTARVERLASCSGDQVPVTITVGANATPARSRSARLVLTAGTRSLSVPVDPRAATTLTLSVDADGLDPADVTVAARARSATGTAAGRLPGRVTERTVPTGRGTSVSVVLRATDRAGHESTVDQQILPVRRDTARAPARHGTAPPVTVLGSVGQTAEVGTGARPPLRITLATAARR
ncbi:glycosyltransferase family 39 protein [Frankia sp. AgB32]|nr:glycosyltransferase family 39 protein [Frankia sp. AgB32]